MSRRDPGPPRGIVESVAGAPFRHARIGPSGELARYLRHFWIVAWELDAPHVQENLPHPAAHFVLERGCSRIVGVMPDRFVREIAGRGMVFGFALRAGVLPCFSREPAWRSRGQMTPLSQLWSDAAELERAALDAESDAERVAIAETWLRARLPPLHSDAERVASIVESIERDPAVTRVEEVAARADTDVRTLQRLFRRWAGVTPKWVIRRYRLHEALARLKTTSAAQLAAELGYTDQAHFAKDFKAVVGRTPAEQARLRA